MTTSMETVHMVKSQPKKTNQKLNISHKTTLFKINYDIFHSTAALSPR